MSILKQVRIRNLRRYGSEFVLDLGPEANILLAPNGTGKTAFFEAVELGLTGAVRRLGDSLTPLVRDGTNSASVTLEFDDARLTTRLERVANTTTRVPSEESRAPVLGGFASETLCYLLPLTHLLDQRNAGWLVQADPKDAGDILARLPLGAGLSQAIRALGSSKPASTAAMKDAEARLEVQRDLLGDWTQACGKVDSATNLNPVPLADLVSRLVKLTGEALPPTPSLDVLQSRCATAITGNRQAWHDAKERSSKLDAVASWIAGWQQQRTAEADADAQQQAAAIEVTAAEVDLANAETQQGVARTEYDARQRERAAAAEEASRVEAATSAWAERARCITEEERAGRARADALQALGEAEREERAERENDIRHGVLLARERALSEVVADLDAAEMDCRSWGEIEGRLTDLIKQEEERSVALVDAERRYQQRMMEVHSRARDHEAAEEVLHQLQVSGSALQSAVVSVARHLSPDRGDCPVCCVDHGAGELQRRLAEALTRADPAVAHARDHAVAASQLLEAARKEAAEASPESLRGEVAALRHRRAELLAEREQCRANPLLNALEVGEARQRLRQRREEGLRALEALEMERAAAPPRPSVEDLAELDARVEAARATRDRAEAAWSAAGIVRRAAEARVATYADIAANTEEVSRVAAVMAASDVALAVADAEWRTTMAATAQARATLEEARAHLKGVEDRLHERQRSVRDHREQWVAAGLPEDPSPSAHASAVASMLKYLARLEDTRVALSEVEQGLAGWRAAETWLSARQTVDELRGPRSREEHDLLLHQQVREIELEIERLGRCRTAVDRLGPLMEIAQRGVRAQLDQVSGPWSRILHRIVRERRFARTLLKTSTSYNRQHAEVNVPLHGNRVPIATIASEAQQAELQLSFLLTMAKAVRWSSWRGLLLDDPTQHHDLPSAASVFDLLRDYVADDGFQLVVATHDTQQAHYFRRMLENDGINTTIHVLAPTSDGVKAEPIRRRA